jgi:hypothetical protein
LLFVVSTGLFGFPSSPSALIFHSDNKAAALLMLTKSVDLVKDAHEEVEQVREPLSLLLIGRRSMTSRGELVIKGIY